MFLSMGNILNNAEIGLLFMCFEKPHRIRVQCKAELLDDVKFKNFFPGSELVVKCTLHELWQNCPRYIHRYKRTAQSRYTPDADGNSPLAEWKRIDLLKMFFPKTTKTKLEMLEKLASTIGLKK